MYAQVCTSYNAWTRKDIKMYINESQTNYYLRGIDNYKYV